MAEQTTAVVSISRHKLLARLGQRPPDVSVAAFKRDVLTARSVGPLVTENCCSLTLNAEKATGKQLYVAYFGRIKYIYRPRGICLLSPVIRVCNTAAVQGWIFGLFFATGLNMEHATEDKKRGETPGYRFRNGERRIHSFSTLSIPSHFTISPIVFQRLDSNMYLVPDTGILVFHEMFPN